MKNNSAIIIYNKFYEIKKTTTEFKNIINIHKYNNSNIIICLKDNIYYYSLNSYNIQKDIKDYEELKNKNLNCLYLFKINNGYYIICCKNETIFYLNLFSRIKQSSINYIDLKSIKSGILINKDYAALKVCTISSNKENENGIYFYLIKKNIIMNKRITNMNYSYIYSTNGLAIMPGKKKETDNKALLCACKKYCKNQKNGILLVNIEIKNNKFNNDINLNHHFYETGHFEVYCFCPILRVEPEKILDNNNIKFIDTDYFLVGGFDLYKYKGIIKLYKVIYGERFFNNKIEYIQDIVLEKSIIENKNEKENEKNIFEGFRGPITSITQVKSSNYKKLLITCWDGKIYLLSFPNINYYLKYDTLVRSNNTFQNFFNHK